MNNRMAIGRSVGLNEEKQAVSFDIQVLCGWDNGKMTNELSFCHKLKFSNT